MVFKNGRHKYIVNKNQLNLNNNKMGKKWNKRKGNVTFTHTHAIMI